MSLRTIVHGILKKGFKIIFFLLIQLKIMYLLSINQTLDLLYVFISNWFNYKFYLQSIFDIPYFNNIIFPHSYEVIPGRIIIHPGYHLS